MEATGKRSGSVLALVLVLGCLLAVPALGALVVGAGLGLAYAFGRDDAGYFEASLDGIETPTAAVTAGAIDFTADPGTPGWLIDALDADVRLRVTGTDPGRDVFVGIAPLVEVAHDEIRDLDDDGTARFRRQAGLDRVEAPTGRTFWIARASGPGTQELNWETEPGRWAVAVMNADGSPGVAAAVDVGVKADVVLPLSVILLAAGLAGAAASVGGWSWSSGGSWPSPTT